MRRLRWPESKRKRGARRMRGLALWEHEISERFGDDYLAAMKWAMSYEGETRFRELSSGQVRRAPREAVSTHSERTA